MILMLINPEEGKFIMGLQFHPERMQDQDSDKFDYPGSAAVYQEFVRAVIAFEKKSSTCVAKPLKLNQEMEKKRMIIIRSFSIARNMYGSEGRSLSGHESELEIGAKFLEVNTSFSLQQEKRLKQMGATVRNASSYIRRLRTNEKKERIARAVMEKMPVEKLSDDVVLQHDEPNLFGGHLERASRPCH